MFVFLHSKGFQYRKLTMIRIKHLLSIDLKGGEMEPAIRVELMTY